MLVATPEEIRAGQVSDVYFARTREVVEARGLNRTVRAELTAHVLPNPYPWAVLAGVEEVLEVLEGRSVTVEGLPEGSLFLPGEPVLSVEGRYLEFGQLETALLGLLCQASGIATKAARCRLAAGDRKVIHFGARRMHPAVAPMIDRAAYLGGCDGVAVRRSAELLGIEPSGTVPHALVLLVGDTVEAMRAFHAVIDRKVPRIALIDTFQDEKFEALRVAEALGRDLAAMRLDTPGSRRGDFHGIVDEVRWELDLRGHRHVELFVSGGLDEVEIAELRPVVAGFGVGTAISSAPVIDLSMDIVEIEGKPVAKRGKRSGGKEVWRCAACGRRQVQPRGHRDRCCDLCGSRLEGQTLTLIREGRRVVGPEPVEEIRRRVLAALEGCTARG